MRRILKTFLFSILLIGLSAQGVLAATLRTCSDVHSSGAPHTPQAMHDAPDIRTALHAGHAGHADHADHAGMHSDDHATSQHDHHAGKSHSSFNPCSFCCMGAAVTTYMMNWALPTYASESPAPAPVMLFAGHFPSGLERPPRLFLQSV